MTDTTYIDTRDVAKMIRKKLKAEFPGVKFAVKMQRYSGGSSIDVKWTDGPTGAMVEAITKNYQGVGFDGMIDLQYSNDAWLLSDGYTIVFAGTGGTTDSMGTVSACQIEAPEPNAKRVRTTCYVFAKRNTSPQLVARCLDRVCRKWGIDRDSVSVAVSDYDGMGYIDRDGDQRMDSGRYISDLVREEAGKYLPASFMAAR